MALTSFPPRSQLQQDNLLQPSPDLSGIEVRLAWTEEEIRLAQRLRYKVFYLERGAHAAPEVLETGRDMDAFDALADHLIVLDHTLEDENGPAVVGTYRLLKRDIAEKGGGFYTAHSFDIGCLLNSGLEPLELGRSCVAPAYRTRPVLQLLWQGIAEYVFDNNIDLLFGCGSFHGADIARWSEALSYLYSYHLAPPGLRPVARDAVYETMQRQDPSTIQPRKIMVDLPPLIKGYLRIGAMVGDGAVIDRHFNTVDVCIVLNREFVAERYMRHYERTTHSAI